MDFFPGKDSLPEVRRHIVKFLGTGAAAPTVVYGRNFSVSRVSAGLYRLTFSQHPGKIIGLGSVAFSASTPTDLAGFSCIADDFVSTGNGTLDVQVCNAANAAADLAANQYVTFEVLFTATTA